MTDTKSIKRTPKQNVILGLKIALNVVFYAIIVLVLFFSIANIRAKNDPTKIPNIFGNGYLTVQSNSMDGSETDSFKKGDLIIVKTATEKRINDLEIGDIITFVDPELGKTQGFSTALNTHRIIYIAENDSQKQYVTVGDYAREGWEKRNNQTFDYKSESYQSLTYSEVLDDLVSKFNNNFQISSAQQIVGVYSSKFSGLGSTVDIVNNNFLIIVVLPVVLFLIFEIAVFIYNLLAYKNEKNRLQEANNGQAMSSEDIEKLKEELKKQLLEDMKKGNDNNNK